MGTCKRAKELIWNDPRQVHRADSGNLSKGNVVEPVDSEKSKVVQVYVAPLEKKFDAAVKMLTKHNLKGLDAFGDPDDLQRILNAQSL